MYRQTCRSVSRAPVISLSPAIAGERLMTTPSSGHSNRRQAVILIGAVHVAVLPDPVSAPAAAPSGSEGASAAAMGVIEVEFAGGERMRITGAVDTAVVTAALAALRGRPA